jgi:hypothetical protein
VKTARVADTSIIDKVSVTQTTTRGILHTFLKFLQSKYEPTQVDDARVTQMEKAGPFRWDEGTSYTLHH